MVWLRCCRAYKAVLPKSPQNSPFTYLWTLTTSQVTLISTTCKTQLILWSIICDSCQVPVLVPAMSSTFSVVPTVSPVLFTKPILWPGPSWNPMAPSSMAGRGAGLILLPAAAGQHSLGWGGKKDHINPEKHCCSIKGMACSLHLQKLTRTVCTAGATLGCSTWPNKHTGPVLSFLVKYMLLFIQEACSFFFAATCHWNRKYGLINIV